MADPVLHIKDSYYFEVPKVLYPAAYTGKGGERPFPEVWVKLDPEFQERQFDRLYGGLTTLQVALPPKHQAHEEWHAWAHHDHANFAKPFDVFLDEHYEQHLAEFQTWKQAQVAKAQAEKDDHAVKIAQQAPIEDFMRDEHENDPYADFVRLRYTGQFQQDWAALRATAGSYAAVREYRTDPAAAEWNKAKIDAYNGHLSGRILIPQPFAELRNLYEKDSGWAISKYMLIEVFVFFVLWVLFSQLAQRVQSGDPPKGKFWNLLEWFLVFIRDQIARPVLGGHDHGHEEAAHADHGHDDRHGAEHGNHGEHSHAAHASGNRHVDPATKFLPLLWTIFFFVLGCNLMGIVPWAGAPTAAFGVTFAMACVTFFTGVAFGIRQFGFGGFLLNQIPPMDVPWYMAILIKPMVFAIEILGLLIKHGVLSVRLLANMVAGHLVILGVMGMAFGAEAALQFTAPGVPGWQWGLTAAIAVFGSAAFSVLELFVAFLQAYVFTFLSTLFIGAAIHKH